MPNNPIILPKGIASADGVVASGQQVSLDTSALSSVNADNTQEAVSELNRLFEIVSSGSGGQPGSRFSGPFVPFTSSVNVGTDNFNTYAGNTALYARSTNARVNFILPTDAEITASSVATDQQVEFTILNQAGTGRFDTGGGSQGPDNTVRIDVTGANNIRRDTETGTLLNFIEAHQNDLVTLTQAERGRPWVATRVTLSSAALLLPTGLFHLQVGVQLSANPALGFLAGIPSGVTPQAGDAYQISVGNDDFGGYGIAEGDVLVALQDNPSRVLSVNNEDWIVIRNATNDIISLSEIHFLNTVTESDAFEDDRLMDRSDVTNARVFLSTGVLDHAPFITPSTDPNNPQTDGTRYVGGNEDVSAGNDFHLTDFTKVGEPSGSSRFPNALVYFDIDGSFNTAELLKDVFLVLHDGQGEEVSRHNASTAFRPVVLTGSSDTYYVLDTVGASDNFSSINYLSGYTISLVLRRTLRSFSLSEAVNALAAIPSGSISLAKLEPNVQALITSDHSLTDAQEVALNGLQTGGTPTVWDYGDLYVRDTSAAPSSDLGHYFNVGQQNGIVSNHGSTRDVTFVVPNFVVVTGLERQDNTAIKLSVTRIGALTVQDNSVNPPRTFNGQGFTATLPSSSFDINNPVGDIWQVDGMATNLELQGAVNSFKIDRANLSDAVVAYIQTLLPSSGGTVSPYTLPTNLQQFSRHLTVASDVASGWSKVEPSPIRATLTRQFAALWDENRRTFGTGNYFADIDEVELLGFTSNTIFYYNTPDDSLNTSFPGAQSYILNDNVRIRNTAGNNNITEDYTKIISFNYALERTLTSGDGDLSMLRVGDASTTSMIGLSEEEGLYLNIGRGDGGQQSRTIVTPLSVTNGHWGTRIDETTIGEAEITLPSSLTGSLTISVSVELDDNGNDEGTHVETINIADVGADQTFSNRVFSFTGFPSITVAFEYDHDNTDLSSTRRVLFLRPTQAFSNAALTYNVSATYNVVETWNHPATYAEFPINAGSGHDDFGLFDPHRYTTEGVLERNRVIFMVQKWEEGDTSSDPELAVRVVVDGEIETTNTRDNLIRLHRPASDFTFDDMSFGNNLCGMAHIQCYNYTGTAPSSVELQRLYSHQADWLGAYYPPGHAVDRVLIDANLELTAGHSIILSSPNGTRYEASFDDTGALDTKVAS